MILPYLLNSNALVGVIQNVITSHQFTRLYGWRMCMMPCGHVPNAPNARLHEITIHITTVGLAQAHPNNSYHMRTNKGERWYHT